MGRPVKVLAISDEERIELKRWLRRRQVPAAEQQRARIIPLSTEGLKGHEVGERFGVTRETVSKWRRRFEQYRIAGLTDAPRSGRRSRVKCHGNQSHHLDIYNEDPKPFVWKKTAEEIVESIARLSNTLNTGRTFVKGYWHYAVRIDPSQKMGLIIQHY